METSFHFVTGKTTTLSLDPNQTIYEIKIKLGDLLQIQPQNIRLLYKSQVLADSRKLVDVHVAQGTSISVLTVRSPPNSYTKPQPNKSARSQNISRMEGSMDNNFPKLPPRKSCKRNCFQDPPYFESLVVNLMDLGFERSKCESALRAAYYNSDRAAEYLIEGNIPTEMTNDVFCLQEQRALLQHDISTNVPTNQPNQISSLTDDQVNSLKNLLDINHYDQDLIIQVFMACDCDEAITSSCLKSMNDLK